MYSIVSNYNDKVEYALLVKKCLDDYCKIEDVNFKAEFINGYYYFKFDSQGIAVEVTASFKQIYDSLMRGNKGKHLIGDGIEDYILNTASELISSAVR
jgi:hypothetical protein